MSKACDYSTVTAEVDWQKPGRNLEDAINYIPVNLEPYLFIEGNRENDCSADGAQF